MLTVTNLSNKLEMPDFIPFQIFRRLPNLKKWTAWGYSALVTPRTVHWQLSCSKFSSLEKTAVEDLNTS